MNTINQIFSSIANTKSNRVAIEINDTRLTYGDVNTHSNKLARYFQEKFQVNSTSVVAIFADQSEWNIIAMLAVAKCGATYLPMLPQFPQDRIKYMLKDSGAKLILGQEKHISIFKPELDTVFYEEIVDAITPFPDLDVESLVTPDQRIYIMYTSGTTGKPNGVEIPHRGIIRLVKNTNYFPFDNAQTFIQLSSISFDASTFEIWGALLNGHKLVLYTQMTVDIASLQITLEKSGVTNVFLTTSYFNLIVDSYLSALKSVKYVLTGGEVISIDHVRMLKQKFPEIEIIHVYGPTENTTFTTFFPITGSLDVNLNTIPIGKAISGTEVFILGKDLLPIGLGDVGEIYTGGLGTALKYINNNELTNKRFVTIKLDGKEKRLYKTGDLGKWNEHDEIEFVGRIDSQVKIRGFRIEIDEIEKAIHSISEVSECCVMVSKHHHEKMLVAFIKLKNQVTLDIKEIRQKLGNWLPDYMIPQRFVFTDHFELNLNGKIDRNKLIAKPNILSDSIVRDNDVSSKQIQDIWSDILQNNSIKPTDDFFEIGNSSINAAMMILRVNKVFDLSLKPVSVYTHPTLHAFTKHVKNVLNQTGKHTHASPIKNYNKEKAGLSKQQESLWLFRNVNPLNAAYNLSFRTEFWGDLNILNLNKAVNCIIERHHILRTRFIDDGKDLYQQVMPFKEMVFNYADTSQMHETQFDSLLLNLIKKPIDIKGEQLHYWHLYKRADNYHVLVLLIHHAIFDGWSVDVLNEEIETVYNTLARGNAIELKPIKRQYIDYSLEQTELLQSDFYHNSIKHWTNIMGVNPNPTEIVPDFNRPVLRGFAGAFEEFQIEGQLYESVLTITSKNKTTLFQFLGACLEIFLDKRCKSGKVHIAIPYHNRENITDISLIGHFVNSIILTSEPDTSLTFTEYLNQRKTEIRELIDNHNVPFDILVKHLAKIRTSGKPPLSQIMYNYLDLRKTGLQLDGLKVVQNDLFNETLMMDLIFTVREYNDLLKLRIEYDVHLYKKDTIKRIIEEFRGFINCIINNPEILIGQIEILTQNASVPALTQAIEINKELYKQKTVNELIDIQKNNNPNDIAVIFENRTTSYLKFLEKSDILSCALIAKNTIEKDSIVAIIMDRSDIMLMSLLGILNAGAAYLPIDSNTPLARTAYILSESKSKFLVCDRANYELIKSCETLPEIIIIEDLLENSKAIQFQRVKVFPDNLAYCLFTSGSTGKPKGVLIENQSVVNFIESTWVEADLCNAGKSILCLTTYCFDIFVLETWMALSKGLKIVMAGEKENLNPVLCVNFINRHQIEIIQGTPSRISWLLEAEGDLSHVKTVIMGGEVLSVSLVKKVWLAFPNAKIIHAYGPTETTVWTSYKVISKNDQITIGKPIVNTQYYVIDKDKNLCSEGVEGELAIGGICLARGYLNNEELTGEKFISSPFNKNERIYLSGDIVKLLPNGEYVYLGRLDNQIKLRGYRIETGEIEQAMTELFNLKQCVVCKCITNEEEQLVAYYVSENKFIGINSLTEETFKSGLGKILPAYMIPSVYVKIDSLPLNQNGKIDRKRLTNFETGSVLNQKEPIQFVQDDVERIMAIWKNVLLVDTISPDDDFFEIGGYSLLAIRITTLINKEFNLELEPTVIFGNRTIASLAGLIGNQSQKNMVTEKIVKIKDGTGEAIFFAPGAKGNEFSFIHFIKYFTDDNKLYSLHYVMNNENDEPVQSLQEMASIYVQHILAIQKNGPFHLLGFSFGGRLVYEMALQLTQNGFEIGTIIIIDTEGIKFPFTFENKIKSKIIRFFSIIYHLKWKDRFAFFLRFIPIKISRTLGVKTKEVIYIGSIKPTADEIVALNFQQKLWESYIPNRKLHSQALLLKGKNDIGRIEYYLNKLSPSYFWEYNMEGRIFVKSSNNSHLDFLSADHVFETIDLVQTYLSVYTIRQLLKKHAVCCESNVTAFFALDSTLVYVLDSTLLISHLEHFKRFLSDSEKSKAARYNRNSDIDNYILRHGFLRFILSQILGIMPDQLEFHINRSGKPCIIGYQNKLNIDFSLSSTHSIFALTITTNNQIGVDIEKVDSSINHMEMAIEFFNPNEVELLKNTETAQVPLEFTKIWTAKEAFIKNHGIRPLKEITIEYNPEMQVVAGGAKCFLMHRLLKDDLALSVTSIKKYHMKLRTLL